MHLYFQIEKETNGFVFLKVPNEFKEFSISFIINLIQYASGQNYVNNINALSKTLPFDAIAQRCPDINIHMLSASGLTKNPSEIKPRPIVVLYKTTRAVEYIVAKRKGHDRIDIFYNPTDEIKQISLPKNNQLLEFPNASEGVPNASEGMFRQTWNNMKKAIRRVFRITPTPHPAPAPAQPFYFKRKDDSKSPNPSRGRDVKKQWITFKPKNPAIAEEKNAAPVKTAAQKHSKNDAKADKPERKKEQSHHHSKRPSRKDNNLRSSNSQREHGSKQHIDIQEVNTATQKPERKKEQSKKPHRDIQEVDTATQKPERKKEKSKKPHRDIQEVDTAAQKSERQPSKNPYGDPQEVNIEEFVRRILRNKK